MACHPCPLRQEFLRVHFQLKTASGDSLLRRKRLYFFTAEEKATFPIHHGVMVISEGRERVFKSGILVEN